MNPFILEANCSIKNYSFAVKPTTVFFLCIICTFFTKKSALGAYYAKEHNIVNFFPQIANAFTDTKSYDKATSTLKNTNTVRK